MLYFSVTHSGVSFMVLQCRLPLFSAYKIHTFGLEIPLYRKSIIIHK